MKMYKYKRRGTDGSSIQPLSLSPRDYANVLLDDSKCSYVICCNHDCYSDRDIEGLPVEICNDFKDSKTGDVLYNIIASVVSFIGPVIMG